MPQGSVLGPILFLVFIITFLTPSVQRWRLFADDTIVYQVVASNYDCMALQEDLEKIIEWERKRGMEFNPKKYEILRVSRCKVPIS